MACPVDLALLLPALERLGRPLLCFRPPVASLGSVSAGILRAARQRGACVGLLVELGEARGRALAAAFAAVVAACEESGYRAPLALLAEGMTVGPDDQTGSPAHLAAMAVEAGFPNLIVPVHATDLARSRAAIEQAIGVARQHELGWVLSIAGEPDRGTLEELLRGLSQRGNSPAALRLDPSVDRDPMPLPLLSILSGSENAGARSDLQSRGARLLELRLALPEGLRGPAAEARAYFLADALLGLWKVDRSAVQVGAELLRTWRN
jgi:hypothetical protein